jgi:hypothetical protein
MTKSMDSWFFMRRPFDTFRLEPDRHRQFLFGSVERKQRDYLLGEIEGASYSSDGHKAVVFGDYGCGKTHTCHNLAYAIEKADMGIYPVYIKCSAYKAKEPFESLFREMVTHIPTTEVQRIATEYSRMVNTRSASPLIDIVHVEDVAFVMSNGLTAVNIDMVRNSMRWLGGEAKVPMKTISEAIKPHLDDSQEFGAVMRGLVHMFRTVDKKILLYLIDEAERFQDISANVDTQSQWLASLRELAEIVGVGMLFFIGARTRNNLPTVLLLDEIVRRIGVANYVEFKTLSRDSIRDFLIELLSTVIAKGAVPDTHRSAFNGELVEDVPEALQQLTDNDPMKLETYPFEPDAFNEFVEQVAAGDLSNKPSEVLIRLQKAAQRAMKNNSRTIDSRIVDAIGSEGL